MDYLKQIHSKLQHDVIQSVHVLKLVKNVHKNSRVLLLCDKNKGGETNIMYLTNLKP
jgi:hypothetical protein